MESNITLSSRREGPFEDIEMQEQEPSRRGIALLAENIGMQEQETTRREVQRNVRNPRAIIPILERIMTRYPLTRHFFGFVIFLSISIMLTIFIVSCLKLYTLFLNKEYIKSLSFGFIVLLGAAFLELSLIWSIELIVGRTCGNRN